MCNHPDNICKDSFVVWLSALSYWCNSVQTESQYSIQLSDYANNTDDPLNYTNIINKNNGHNGFIYGCSAAINLGGWDKGLEGPTTRICSTLRMLKRLNIFDNSSEVSGCLPVVISPPYVPHGQCGSTWIAVCSGARCTDKTKCDWAAPCPKETPFLCVMTD